MSKYTKFLQFRGLQTSIFTPWYILCITLSCTLIIYAEDPVSIVSYQPEHVQLLGPKEKIPPVPTMQTPEQDHYLSAHDPAFRNTKTLNKPYGTLEENGVGKFEDIDNKALTGIKELGVSHIWYTGVIEHALLTDYTAYGIPLDDADVVKGRAGSPYSIKDYYDVNPDLAVDVKNRMLEFERLVKRTHDQDLKVIIDFIPNHVARRYHSDVKPDGVKDLGETDDKTKAFHPDNNFYYLPGQAFQVPDGYNSLGDNSFRQKMESSTRTRRKQRATINSLQHRVLTTGLKRPS